MKKIFFLAALLMVLSSCADSKTFRKSDGTTFEATPYGWANYQTRKIDGVIYECNLGNAILSIVGIETIILPIWLSGWEIMEPISYIEP